MKIAARAYGKRTRITHKVIDTEHMLDLRGDDDGNVTFTMYTPKLGMHGEFRFHFSLSAADVQKLLRASTLGHLMQRIDDLEEEVRSLREE